MRCLVLRGGEYFMAGGDLKWFSTLVQGRSSGENRLQFEALIQEVHTGLPVLRRMPKPVLGERARRGRRIRHQPHDGVPPSRSPPTARIFTPAYTLIGVSPNCDSTIALPCIVGQTKAHGDPAPRGERRRYNGRAAAVNRVCACCITSAETSRQPSSPAA